MGYLLKIIAALLVAVVAACIISPEIKNEVMLSGLRSYVAFQAWNAGIDRNARPSIESNLLIEGLKSQDMRGASVDPEKPNWDQERRLMEEAMAIKSPFPALLSPCTRSPIAQLAHLDALWIDCSGPGSEARVEKAVVFVHGGGYVLGSAASYQGTVATVAQEWQAAATRHTEVPETAFKFVLFNYRRAPEVSLADIASDCLSVYQWLLEDFSSEDIIFTGDSAGGNMVLNLQLEAMRNDLPAPAAGIAMSPWLDLTGTDRDSYDRNTGKDPILSGQFMRHLISDVGPDEADRVFYSPSAMDADTLSTLAPTLLQIGSLDVFVDENIEFGWTTAEIEHIKVTVYDGMFHVFGNMPNILPEARDAIAEAIAFLQKHGAI